MTTAKTFEVVVDHDTGSAVELLVAASGLSKQAVKQAMQKGAVWWRRRGQPQRLRRAKKALQRGDQLFFYYNPAVLAATVEPPRLIADEGDYSVWYKPYGMLCQGSKWSDHCAIHRWVEQHLQPQRPAFIVHRLDRAATGLVLIAHKKSVAAALAGLFERRALQKNYRVKVNGDFRRLYSPVTVARSLDGKAALSHFRCVASNGRQSLLDVQIDSGRKHQIRRHLAGLGFAVVGDRFHGDGNGDEDLQLTACRLRFRCPVTGRQRDYHLADDLLPRL